MDDTDSISKTQTSDGYPSGLKLIRELGRGSSGVVELVEDSTGRRLALKCVPFHHGNGSAHAREVRALKILMGKIGDVPGLIRVLHVDQGINELWYTMELADLREESSSVITLDDEIKHQGALDPAVGLDLVEQLAQTVQRLHELGAVHRDIKPSNILRVDGQWKLGDIGLLGEERTEMTAVGTPDFIPPWGPIDRRADLYALGRVLYCLVTGLSARSFPTLLPQMLTPERQKTTKIINRLITTACEPDPDKRFQNCDDFLNAIQKTRSELLLASSALLSRRGVIRVGGCALVLGATGVAVRSLIRAKATSSPVWQTLFDGESLDGWYVDSPEHGPWLVDHGAITAPLSSNFQSLMTHSQFGPGRYQALVTPLNDRSRLGINFGQPGGSHFLFFEDKYVWIRNGKKAEDEEQPERWRSFPGLIYPGTGQSVLMEIDWDSDTTKLLIDGQVLQEVPTHSAQGKLGLHVWGGDGGKFSDIKYRQHS